MEKKGKNMLLHISGVLPRGIGIEGGRRGGGRNSLWKYMEEKNLKIENNTGLTIAQTLFQSYQEGEPRRKGIGVGVDGGNGKLREECRLALTRGEREGDEDSEIRRGFLPTIAHSSSFKEIRDDIHYKEDTTEYKPKNKDIKQDKQEKEHMNHLLEQICNYNPKEEQEINERHYIKLNNILSQSKINLNSKKALHKISKELSEKSFQEGLAMGNESYRLNQQKAFKTLKVTNNRNQLKHNQILPQIIGSQVKRKKYSKFTKYLHQVEDNNIHSIDNIDNTHHLSSFYIKKKQIPASNVSIGTKMSMKFNPRLKTDAYNENHKVVKLLQNESLETTNKIINLDFMQNKKLNLVRQQRNNFESMGSEIEEQEVLIRKLYVILRGGGDVERIKGLIESNPQLLIKLFTAGQSILHVAVKGGNLDTVKYLIKKGLNPHCPDQLNRSSFNIAQLHKKYLIMAYFKDTFDYQYRFQ